MNKVMINSIIFNLVLIIGAIFIILKLANIIDWNWLLVLSPFWGVILLYIIIYIICSIGLKITLWLISRRKR